MLAAHFIFILYCLCLVIILFLYFFVYSRFAFGKNNIKETSGFPPLSVIICARNEEYALRKNLPFIMEQDYPVYEVIVVNDCSSDLTGRVLEEYGKKYPHLRSTVIKEDALYKHGKKLPMTVGIRSAQYDRVVFTDADCIPVGRDWLKGVASHFDDHTEIVLGYGAYKKKPGLVNLLIRMDTFRIGLQYISLALAGMPYMGVGRNLAYRKSLFLREKGFAPFSHVLSGDDDLFVNKTAVKSNTRVAVSPDCITLSEPKMTFKEWLNQKRRHVSTARYYKKNTLLVLGIFSFSQYLFWLSFIALLFFPSFRLIALSLFITKILFQLLLYHKSMKKLGESDFLLYSPVLEWLIIFVFYPIVALSNMVYKNVAWKI